MQTFDNNQSTTNRDCNSRNSFVKKSKIEGLETTTAQKRDMSFELTEGSELNVTRVKPNQDDEDDKTYTTPSLRPKQDRGHQLGFPDNFMVQLASPTFKLHLDNKLHLHQFASSPSSYLLPKFVNSSSGEDLGKEESDGTEKITESDASVSQIRSNSQSQIKIHINDQSQQGMLMTLGVPAHQKRHRKSISMTPESQQKIVLSKSQFLKQKNKSLTLSKPEKASSSPKPKVFKISKALVTIFKQHEAPEKIPSRVFGVINDKSLVTKSSGFFVNKNRTKKESILKLTKILRKHADLQNNKNMNNIQLLQVVKKLKKRRLGLVKKVKDMASEFVEKVVEFKRATRAWVRDITRPFRPDQNFRFAWDILVVLAVLIDLVLVPFKLSFKDKAESEGDSIIGRLDTGLTIFFFLDILLSFHTSFYQDGTLIFRHKAIAIDYLKGWFIVDIIASFPYQWTSSYASSSPDTDDKYYPRSPFSEPLNLLRFVNLLQGVRVFKLIRIMEKLMVYMDFKPLINGVISLIKLFLMIFYLSHWCACGWHLIAIDIEGDDWTGKFGLSNASVQDVYIASLYFCLTTLLTVGFGDITPSTSLERVYAMFVMLLGGCVFGYVMNSIAIIILSLEDEKVKVHKKINSLARFLQKEGLTKDVQIDVKKYLEFIHEGKHKMKQSDKEMMDSLSQDLKDRIYEQINGKLLHGSKLLSENFTKKLLHQILTHFEEKTFIPNEKIFDGLTTECSLYFISKGSVNLFLHKGGEPLFTLKKGDHIGEISFFTEMPRLLTAHSIDFSRLLMLKRDQFLQTLREYPEDWQMFTMIRDKILTYKDYHSLNLQCLICEEPGHILETCPKIHFIPNAELVIENYIDEEQYFRSSFVRGARAKFNARKKFNFLNTEASKIVSKISSKLSEIRPDNEMLDGEYRSKVDEEDLDSPDSMEKYSAPRSQGKTKSNLLTETTYGNLKQVTLDRLDPVSAKSLWTVLYNRKLEELKVLRASMKDLDMLSKKELFSMMDEPDEEEELVMDQVMNYSTYFPHNNVVKIADLIHQKRKKPLQTDQETRKLKQHLRRFFEAYDKEREKVRQEMQALKRSKSKTLIFKPQIFTP